MMAAAVTRMTLNRSRTNQPRMAGRERSGEVLLERSLVVVEVEKVEKMEKVDKVEDEMVGDGDDDGAMIGVRYGWTASYLNCVSVRVVHVISTATSAVAIDTRIVSPQRLASVTASVVF
jgi:hypothetical protein